jgi:hypothetical protein
VEQVEGGDDNNPGTASTVGYVVVVVVVRNGSLDRWKWPEWRNNYYSLAQITLTPVQIS